ncbi:unnamed protein product [Rhizophagus irregularis]|nr:unnamed protein product [Rhizophagus irregularis]
MSNNNNINPSNITIKEIVNELKLQRDVNFHANIIRYYGITKLESENKIDQTKNYLLVMECADGACSVSFLHDEGIVHRDLHSCNVEKIIPNTPNDYSNLYTECWKGKPNNRPFMHEVVDRYDDYK